MSKLKYVIDRLEKVKKNSDGFSALCPAHDDTNPSLSIKESPEGNVLLHCHAGCDVKTIVESVGLTMNDLFPDTKTQGPINGSKIIATYNYTDETGRLLYQVCRTKDKNFFIQRPDGQGSFINGFGDSQWVLYKLPELLKAIEEGDTIFYPEGEKDCDNLHELGLTSTTNPLGAGKWRDEYANLFNGAKVVILPDNDAVGQKHAQVIANGMINHAESIKVLHLPQLPEKGDVSDWIDNGGTAEQLKILVDSTPSWQAKGPITKDESNCEDDQDTVKKGPADLIADLAMSTATLFHNETKETFARVDVGDHFEIWPIDSKDFKRWLTHLYYSSTGKSPGSETMRQAMSMLDAEAIHKGSMHKLSLRVAGDKDLFFYDLADSEWRAIQIEPTGWSLLEKPPVIFRRRKNTCGQVLPLNGGNLNMLKTYINLKDQNDWILLNALIVSSFVPDIPHPISVFYGDKGSAKTTAQRVLRKLIDPAHRDTMTLPTNKNELVLILMTNYSPCFDNLDGINPWQSDILCQAATGGGISKRELYTDVDEVIMSFLRCPMLNGINNIVTRDDLLDRSVLFQLERIDPSRRKEDAVFWEEFERERPYILGAILDTLAKAMNIRPKNNLNRLPRMADFARWGFAITEALGESGEAFIAAYEKNIAQANEEAIQADIVATAICELMSGRVEWESSMTELLEELSTTPGIDAKSKGWPKRPHALSRQINKMKSSLMDIGIEVERYRNDSARCIRITKPPKMESLASIESDANESCALATDTKPEHAIESAMQASV